MYTHLRRRRPSQIMARPSCFEDASGEVREAERGHLVGLGRAGRHGTVAGWQGSAVQRRRGGRIDVIQASRQYRGGQVSRWSHPAPRVRLYIYEHPNRAAVGVNRKGLREQSAALAHDTQSGTQKGRYVTMAPYLPHRAHASHIPVLTPGRESLAR